MIGENSYVFCAGLWIRINFFRIRIQSLMLETNTDPDPIRIQGFNDQKLKKNYSWKFFLFFFIKNCNYLSLGLHKVCPSYRRSLQLSKEAIQHFKTWTFTNYCLLLWVIFAFLARLNTDPIRIRIHSPSSVFVNLPILSVVGSTCLSEHLFDLVLIPAVFFSRRYLSVFFLLSCAIGWMRYAMFF